ncbi:MAG: methyltransferase domain-containing protein [Planctomycetota bacterium]|nr:methyltransferase domain-containing protein [Planctomycetota bacterium]
MTPTAEDIRHFESLLQRLVEMGAAPAALYGAGRWARGLAPALRAAPGLLAGIIDDDARKHGGRWAGLEVLSLDEAVRRGVKGVIITAAAPAQDALWERRHALRDAGMYVLTSPARFRSEPWDDALVEQYECSVARERGLPRLYTLSYPAPDYDIPAPLVERLAAMLPEGGTACEIGAGSGVATRHLLGRAAAYHCVDRSARGLYELLEHRFHASRAKLRLHVDPSARLSGVPDGAVDLVFSLGVMVHLKSDLVHQFLEAIARVLKPSGRALLEFAQWNDAGIAHWRRHHAAAHVGEHSIIYYNHIEGLTASARACGLSARVVGPGDGPFFLAEFARARSL